MAHALISAVNLAEVATVLVRLGMPIDEAESLLREVIGEAALFDQQQAYQAAKIKGLPNAKGLSLGDRACLALGVLKGLPILTADKAWGQLPLNAKIEFIH